MEKTSENNINVVNLRETELRLGLPGSVSPERKAKNGVPLFGKVLEESRLNKFASGAKRGFCDATNASDKWGFVGSEVLKTCVVESDNNNNLKSCLGGFLVKESCLCSTSLKHVEEKKKTSPLNESASKAQVVGWPPIKSFRKNTLATNVSKNADVVEGTTTSSCIYVKVSMDGAPYLRKVDLRTYCNYPELSSALESMFSCFTIGQCTSERESLTVNRLMDLVHGSEYVLTYEDKDGDWMLVGDVPWNMFTNSCKRLRIMRGSEAVGLAPRAMEKCKSQH